MMEQSDSRKAHGHAILVTSCDHIVISHGTARLRHIFHTASVGALNIVAKGEEGVGSQCHIMHLV